MVLQLANKRAYFYIPELVPPLISTEEKSESPCRYWSPACLLAHLRQTSSRGHKAQRNTAGYCVPSWLRTTLKQTLRNLCIHLTVAAGLLEHLGWGGGEGWLEVRLTSLTATELHEFQEWNGRLRDGASKRKVISETSEV